MKLFNLPVILLLLCSFANAQVPVTFNVNMSYQIELGAFNPDNDFVDVAGTFNNWGDNLTKLADPDGDKIYSVTIDQLPVGVIIEFKFRKNGSWDGTEEFPGGGPNRGYQVVDGENILNYWYNDETSPDGPPIANFINVDSRIYENGVIWFADQSAGNVTYREWQFPGGTPSSSTDRAPKVRYPDQGIYDVMLIVGNENSADTIIQSQAITVEERFYEEVEWWNNSVFYEIFVRSFYDSNGDGIGDFRGIIEKLDYLNDGDPNTSTDLGITGIWLMPIHDSPSYHGYDVTDYKSINPDYGTMEDFKAFLEAAHERGIKVIIDYVMNHSSTQHPWFINSASSPTAEKRNWYRWEDNKPGYNGPWGQEVWHNRSGDYYYGLFWGGMPDLNYEEPAVKDTMFGIADFWLQEVGVDGFRLDAVKYIFEDGTILEDTESTFDFFGDFRAHYKATDSNAFTVGEAWTSTDKIRNYVENDRLDFCFDFDLANTIITSLFFGDATFIGFQLQKVFNVYPHLQYGTFLTNHDQNRIMTIFGENEQLVKTAASIYLTTPGVPFLYYGEEIGMTGEKPDEDIRLPMQWSSASNAGFSSSAPWRTPNSNFRQYNVASAERDPNSILSWYKQLIQLRNQEKGLQEGDIFVGSSDNLGTLVFLRQYLDDNYLVMINVSSEDATNIPLNLNPSDLQTGTYTATELLTGNNMVLEVDANQLISGMDIGAYETLILKFNNTTSSENFEIPELLTFYPNPVIDQLFIQTKNGTQQDLNYFIANPLGQILQQGQLNGLASQQSLNVEALPKGFYILSCFQKGFQQTFKFLKK